MVEIHVYGNLRRYAKDTRTDHQSVLVVQPHPDETIGSLLAQAGIPVDEINHIFFNAELLASRSRMAPFMGYLQSRPDVSDRDLEVPVENGDRIGLFGTDMPVLGM
jgi:hypothetical protein